MKAISIILLCLNAFITCNTAADTMAVNQTIRDGQTIVSPQESFELGFFTPGNTTQNRYLGIWYKRLATGTVVWVANRETPIRSKSGELTLLPGGVLVLRDSATNGTIWSSSSSSQVAATNPVAQLLDSGNFMVIDGGDSPKNYMWQSFDQPGNIALPVMKVGRNLERGIVINRTSWKSDDDPSQGDYMVYMDFNGLPQIYQKKGDAIQYRLGSWNGFTYTGATTYKPNPFYVDSYVSNERETYGTFNLVNSSVLCHLMITPEGNLGWWSWSNRTQGWLLYSTPTTDSCERYALCGVYGSCDIGQSPTCGCLEGFKPKRPDQWGLADWTSGCQRGIPLDCGVGEGFRKYSNVKLPDTRRSWFDGNMTIERCEVKCRNECNCMAYTTLAIKYGTGCLLWYEELIDIRIFSENGQDIYIRVAAAELEKDKRVSRSNKKVMIIIISVMIGLVVLLGVCMLIIRKRKLKPQGKVFLIGGIAFSTIVLLTFYIKHTI